MKKLLNIGKDTQRQLYEVGIESEEELRRIGAKEVWLKLQAIDPSACINRLYALEGAIQGIKKTDLSQDDKEDLKKFYNEHKLD